MAKKAGRPSDSPNRDYAQSDAVPSCCPKCQSTERSDYGAKTEQPCVGIHEGKPYTHVIWRTCMCLLCGQWRRDRSFENRTAE